MERSSPLDVTIIDKDESSEKSYHVVDGFIIEDSKSPFPQNGHLSFVPDEYGKEKTILPAKKPRHQANPSTTGDLPINDVRDKTSPSADPIPPGHLLCEFCHGVGPLETFLPPSRRFCSLTCCKRYSAEKRYYPYGKDEQGIAKAIEEGLLNPKSRHMMSGSKAQVVRDQRRRKLAYYGNQDNSSPKSAKKKKCARPPNSGTTAAQRKLDRQASRPVIMDPYVHPSGMSLHTWTVEDVGAFLTFLGYEAYLDRFLEHEIDGNALSLVKDHHLLMTLKLRLGPTLKICEHVSAIKSMEEGLDDF